MEFKRSKIYSVLHTRCPQCHEGQLFERNAMSTGFMQMNKRCACCGLDFVQEPSFYFGAMYFSYAFQVTLFVVIYVALALTIDPPVYAYIVSIISAAIILLPLNYRWSRAAWLTFFGRYNNATLKQPKI
jgi:uncharacterized protein (DUF983 family)